MGVLRGEDGYVNGGVGITGTSFKGQVVKVWIKGLRLGFELCKWVYDQGSRDNGGILQRKSDVGGGNQGTETGVQTVQMGM